MFTVRSLASGDFLYNNGTRVPYRPSPHKWPGFGSGGRKFLVMHYTGGASGQSSLDWFADPGSRVSAHILVDRDGTVTQCVSFKDRAWHCGSSRWRDRDGQVFTELNHWSIGIELANSGACRRTASGTWKNGLGVAVAASDIIEAQHKNGPIFFSPNPHGVPSGSDPKPGWEVYPSEQLFAARSVAAALVAHYGLAEIVGHDDISPGRKSDPGPLFDITGFREAVDGGGGGGSASWRVRPGTPGGLAIRVGPGKDFAKVQETNLPVGTLVVLNERQGLWWHVTVLDAQGDNDLDGWVFSTYLTPA